ncbi:MAG: hypothetical protein EDM03_08270 [Porphyrobacter sp. IPPAS B-1204]|nr:MAG: hypothetical protein EDM03_08270 [Porphyrobacter sp. IPPAS B-1204]
MKAAALALLALALPGCTGAGGDPSPLSATSAPTTHETHDWNGDGILDRAAIVEGDDGLILQFETGGPDGLVQSLTLQDDGSLLYPGVAKEGERLVLTQLTGGTTAVASTHSFAWDSTLGAMRLMALEATLYSRTFAHDGLEAVWDPIGGTLATHTLRLRQGGGDQAYDITDEKVTAKPSAPIRLEDAPSGDSLLPYPYGD